MFADEYLEPVWELAEAAVDVVGDPELAGVGHALRRPGGVVALVVAVRPWLGFEPPAAVAVALEPHERAVAVVPGAVFQAVGVARSGRDLGADPEVARP